MISALNKHATSNWGWPRRSRRHTRVLGWARHKDGASSAPALQAKYERRVAKSPSPSSGSSSSSDSEEGKRGAVGAIADEPTLGASAVGKPLLAIADASAQAAVPAAPVEALASETAIVAVPKNGPRGRARYHIPKGSCPRCWLLKQGFPIAGRCHDRTSPDCAKSHTGSLV